MLQVDIGECCGDSLVVYFKDGQEPQEVDLLLEMRWALQSAGDVSAAEAPTVWPSYTFWPFIGNGGAQMVLISFAFESDALDFGEGASVGGADGIHADYGFMVLELNSDIRGRITSVRAVPTKGGSMAIIGFRDLGTTSNDPKDSIYRIQYDVLSRQTSAERLFVTGLISLPLNDGSMSFIAFTNRYQSEVVVLTDPWIIEKPVEIVQRFGTPPILDLTTGEVVGYHFFGIDGDDSTAQTPPRGISNPWHTGYPRLGMDTLTLVANTAADPDVAQVYEVAMRIIPQDRVANLTDEVFRTAYVRMGLDVSIPAMGGARPIDAGLYVVATGTSDEFVGLKVVDSRGGIKQRCLIQSESGGVTGIYDPFVFLSDKPDIHEDLPAIDSPVQKMMRRIRCASRWRCDDA